MPEGIHKRVCSGRQKSLSLSGSFIVVHGHQGEKAGAAGGERKLLCLLKDDAAPDRGWTALGMCKPGGLDEKRTDLRRLCGTGRFSE